MWKKFKHYSYMHGTYTNIWHILNCSMLISKLILVMYLAIALSMLCSFVTCLLLKIPVSKRWKQNNQAKDLEACAKSRGDLFLHSQSRKKPWNLFLLQHGSHWKCRESWTTSSHSWTFSSHFPWQNNSAGTYTYQASLSLAFKLPVGCRCGSMLRVPLQRAWGGFASCLKSCLGAYLLPGAKCGAA